MVTLSAATQMSGLSRMTLLRKDAEGILETRKICGRRLVVVDSLRKLLGLNDGEQAA